MSNWYMGSQEDLDFLQHYGVLGMKWGHRKSRPSGGANSAKRAKRKKLAKRLAIGAGTAAAAGLAGAYAYKKYKSGQRLGLPGGSRLAIGTAPRRLASSSGNRLALPAPGGSNLPAVVNRSSSGGNALARVGSRSLSTARANLNGLKNVAQPKSGNKKTWMNSMHRIGNTYYQGDYMVKQGAKAAAGVGAAGAAGYAVSKRNGKKTKKKR